MDYKIKSKILSKALDGIKEFKNLEETKSISVVVDRKIFSDKKYKLFFKELNEILEHCKNLEELIVCCDKETRSIINLNSITLLKLKRLVLEGINLEDTSLENFLKRHDNISYLGLMKCNISDINFLHFASNNLKKVNLSENPISPEFADDILQLRKEKFKYLNIDGCEEVLEELDKKVSKFLKFFTKNDNMEKGDIYRKYDKALKSTIFSIEDLEQLSEYIGYFSEERKNEEMNLHLDPPYDYDEEYLKKINLYGSRKNTILYLTLEDVEYLKGKISKDVKVCIYIDNANELSVKDLEELEKEYNIQKVRMKKSDNSLDKQQLEPYNVEEYKKCRKVIDDILEGIDLSYEPYDENRDKKIFGQVILRLANHISYDYQGLKKQKILKELIDNEEKDKSTNSNISEVLYNVEGKFYKLSEIKDEYKEIVKKLRNMEGGLLNNTCVCGGYAEIVRNVFACCGIDVRYISCDPVLEERSGHAWNQIELDGIWYNMDLTFDRDGLVNKKVPLYLLKSDEDFNKTHYNEFIVYDSELLYKCSKTLPTDELTKLIYGEVVKEDIIKEKFSITEYFYSIKELFEDAYSLSCELINKKSNFLHRIVGKLRENDIEGAYNIIKETLKRRRDELEIEDNKGIQEKDE